MTVGVDLGLAALLGRAIPVGVTPIVEHESLDLVLVDRGGGPSDPWHAVVEMKFASRLHDRQLAKYAAKARSRRQESPPELRLVSLFDPIDPRELRGTGFRRVDLLDEIGVALEHSLPRLERGDEDALVRLWTSYLRSLRRLRGHLVSLGTDGDLAFGRAIVASKLRSLFEAQRLLPTRDRVQSVVEDVVLAQTGRETVVMDNTHGAPLLEVNLWPVPARRTKYGLQWQGTNLKLFVCFGTKQLDRFAAVEPAREDALKFLADRLRRAVPHVFASGASTPWKCNKRGSFRSITLSKWDPWDDVSERPAQFAALARALADDREARACVVELHRRAFG